MRVTALVVSALVALGCESPGETDAPRPEGQQQISVAEGDVVVAEVDGVPITASRVRQLSEATGRPPAEVVERLVEFELLAAEARRRGFSRDRGARHAKRQALVQRYLEAEFEASHRQEDMTEAMLRAAYEHNKRAFVRPRAIKVAHILAYAEEGTPSEANRGKARRLARQIYADALTATSLEEFLEVGERYREESSIEIRVEDLAAPVTRSPRLLKSFVDAAMALEEPGDVSEPVDTKFGTHVIVLKEARNAIDRSFDEARIEVATKEHPFWVKAEFFRLTEDLRLSSKVTGYTGVQRRDTKN